MLDCQEPGYLADFIAQNTALRYDDKQAILEELSPLVRLRKLNGFLARERDVLGYERQMEGKVRDELAQQQKEQILRTQIRVLQNELGEDEDNEIEEYRQKLAELKLEDETREHLEKEINKLAKQPYVSAEASVIRNYLDVCLELPWGTYTQGAPECGRGPEGAGPGSLRPGKGEGADSGDHRRPADESGGEGADHLSGGPSRRGQDLHRPVRCQGAEPEAQPAFLWAASGTRPTSAATGKPISAPCRAASWRPSAAAAP